MDLLPPGAEEEVVLLVVESELDMVSVVSQGCTSTAVMCCYGIFSSCDSSYPTNNGDLLAGILV